MALKEIRLKKGLSQSQLAAASKVSLRSIQGFEQGVRNMNGVHLSTLCDLAIALDCKIIDLLTDEELKQRYKLVR